MCVLACCALLSGQQHVADVVGHGEQHALCERHRRQVSTSDCFFVLWRPVLFLTEAKIKRGEKYGAIVCWVFQAFVGIFGYGDFVFPFFVLYTKEAIVAPKN